MWKVINLIIWLLMIQNYLLIINDNLDVFLKYWLITFKHYYIIVIVISSCFIRYIMYMED